MIQFLQIIPTKCTQLNALILQNSMSRASLFHHQGVQLYETIGRPYYHLLLILQNFFVFRATPVYHQGVQL
jgi:hypothetical protein